VTYVIAMTTVGASEDADAMSRALVAERLAACVQRVAISSVYRWEGEVCTDAEVLLLIKTAAEVVDRLEQWVRTHHPYQTPEFLVVPVVAGLPAYFAWIDEETAERD
jgi:periplasmic divalent cation tolerance protein